MVDREERILEPSTGAGSILRQESGGGCMSRKVVSKKPGAVQIHKSLIKGHTQVLDADISGFFDNIPHSELMKCVARRVSDGRMLHLIKMWLKNPIEETDEKGRKRYTGGKKSKRGTPQEGVISPLLANIYMHRYIKAFKRHGLDRKYGAVLVSYADDFVVFCRR